MGATRLLVSLASPAIPGVVAASVDPRRRCGAAELGDE
jgi:hypothetical protein